MFQTGLLLIIRRYCSVYTTVGICHAFMLTGCWQDQNGTKKKKPHIFDSMQHCWQQYIIHPCWQIFFIEIQKYILWYIEIVEFHLMTCQQNSMRIPVVDRTCQLRTPLVNSWNIFYVLLTASRYNRVKKNQLDAQLIIFRQPLHVSGICRPIIRRYNHMYTTIGTYYSF